MRKIILMLAVSIGMIAPSKAQVPCVLSTSVTGAICCAPGSVTIAAAFSATNCSCVNYSYQWTPTAGLSNPTGSITVASPSTTTSYTLCATAYQFQGCSSVCCTACTVVTVAVSNNCCRLIGIEEEELNTHARLYPNPARNVLNLEIKSPLNNGNVSIFDVQGKLVDKKQLAVATGTMPIDISKLEQGIYLVSIKDGDKEIYSRKVVVEK